MWWPGTVGLVGKVKGVDLVGAGRGTRNRQDRREEVEVKHFLIEGGLYPG